MMIQVPSHDGKKTKANLSKYPLSRQFFPRCNTIDTTKSAQQKRRFSPCFYPSARKTQYATASHMHIQRGTEKIPVNFFFYALLKYALHSIPKPVAFAALRRSLLPYSLSGSPPSLTPAFQTRPTAPYLQEHFNLRRCRDLRPSTNCHPGGFAL